MLTGISYLCRPGVIGTLASTEMLTSSTFSDRISEVGYVTLICAKSLHSTLKTKKVTMKLRNRFLQDGKTSAGTVVTFASTEMLTASTFSDRVSKVEYVTLICAKSLHSTPKTKKVTTKLLAFFFT